MKMMEAARLLGVTYSILYSKYREAFGKIGYKSDLAKCADSKEESKDVQSDDQEEKPSKRKGPSIAQTKRKKRKVEAESEVDDDYVPSDAEEDDLRQEDSPKDADYELDVEDKEAKNFSSGEKRQKRKYTKRRHPGPTAEELLSKETDPEVIKLQKEFSANDGNWWKPPKPRNAEATQAALRDVISACAPSRFRVKKAGRFFNIAPVDKRHYPWHGMNLEGRRPVFAAILGVVRSGMLFSDMVYQCTFISKLSGTNLD